ncbi:ligand-binding sensor domain-containing diguanylate cyclase [Tahibacter soli]|uniref:diguanylate cyclase n=1 Tax=Tahibacter soli TaxID=2983605 RepID=A0A9X4BMK9_9GAMM|nr:GGDEF domain-containing protein [Tahibacter soli]MDC8015434.1 GGDEF domain-containing protein [Tahibacter soli]
MRWHAWRTGICGVALLAASFAFAGTPLTARFKPDIDVYPQYFSVARSADGLLYLGGVDRVLRYDGVRWESFATPKPGPVRALALDRTGRLWAGGTEWFGRIERAADGGERFVDCAPAFAADIGDAGFADIWDVVARDDGIYFRALRHLFHADAQCRRVHAWHAPNRFGGIVDHAGQLVVNFRGEGLKRLAGDAFEPFPGGEAFAAKAAFFLMSLDDKRLLVQDATPRLALVEDGRVTVLRDDEAMSHVSAALALDANRAAFGGDDGKLRIVDIADGSLREIPLGISFQSGMARDRDGAIVVGDSEGAVRVPWPPAWSAYGVADGVTGSIHDATLVDGVLRLQTGAGEVAAPWGDRGAATAFAPQRTTTNEAWALFVDGDARILAESHGLRRLDAGGAALGPDDLYARVFERSPFDPARVWVGTESGFAVLDRDADGWRLVARHTDLRTRVMSLVETARGDVWLGTEGRGLLRAHVAANGALESLVDYRKEIGAEADIETTVSTLDGTLVASAATGLFAWNGERFARDDLGGLAPLLARDETVRLRAGTDGTAWAWSWRAVYRRDANGTWRRIDELGATNGVIEALRPLPGGDVVVGTTGRLLHYDAATSGGAQREPVAHLASVRLTPREGEPRALPLAATATLPYGGGTLAFQLGLADLAHGAAPQFRVRLAGLDARWSAWNPRAEFSYAQIPPGDYRFEAQARTAGGRELDVPAFAFRVEPRWYQHGGMQLAAALALAALVALALGASHRTRIRRLAQRNRELDALVHAHTSELELANSQLRDLAERDGLTGVANRRRSDAFLAATIAAAQQTHRPYAVLLVDVDHFKTYNDTHGHLAGDEVLKRVAATLCAHVRDNTLVARFGGEEFCLVVPHCDAAAATELGRRLCRVVAEQCPGVTISIGVATGDGGETAAQRLARADAALYRAKRNGRDRVESE